jgi:hypothetical protein
MPDFLFDTKIEGLAWLPATQREGVARELSALTVDGGPLHARNKHRDPNYALFDYAQASIANHGETLHNELIAPFCRKITGVEPNELLALWSRAAWLPLYWPETALRGAQGDRRALPDVPFHVIDGGPMRGLIDVILRRLRAQPNVTHLNGAITRIAQTASGIAIEVGDERLTAVSLVWGAEAGPLLEAVGVGTATPLDRSALTVALALVRRDAITCPDVGVTIIPRDETLPYRITNQSASAGELGPFARVSCEWNTSYIQGDDREVEERMRAALLATGMVGDDDAVEHVKVIRVAKALALPSAANRVRCETARAAIDALGLPIQVVGPAAGFGVASLNDQIVQALQVAARIDADASSTRSAA